MNGNSIRNCVFSNNTFIISKNNIDKKKEENIISRNTTMNQQQLPQFDNPDFQKLAVYLNSSLEPIKQNI